MTQHWCSGGGSALAGFNAEPPVGAAVDGIAAVRLVGGRAGPAGACEYGHLELLITGFWVAINEQGFRPDIGRSGIEVARVRVR